MKQYIVLIGMIALGLAICNVIAGDEGSILSAMVGLWEKELAIRAYKP